MARSLQMTYAVRLPGRAPSAVPDRPVVRIPGCRRLVRHVLAAILAVTTLVVDAPLASAWDIWIYETNSPSGLTPFNGRGPESSRMISLMFEPLFQFKYLGEYEPVLAGTRWQERNSLVVTMRSDAYFHRTEYSGASTTPRIDSMRVRARDVIATYKLLTNPRSWLASQWYASRLKTYVQRAEAIDDTTVRFTFIGTRPTEQVLDFPIVPEAAIGDLAWEEYAKEGSRQREFEVQPWGARPFIYEWRSSRPDNYVLRRHPAGGSTLVGSVRVRVVDEARLDAFLRGADPAIPICIPALPTGMMVDPNILKAQRVYPPVIQEVIFNARRGPLSDRRVRAALSMMISRQDLMNSMNNEADTITGPFPSWFQGTCDTCVTRYYSYHPAYAAALLDSSGWILEPGGQRVQNGAPLAVTILAYGGSSGSQDAEFASRIAAAWKELGVDARPEVTTTQDQYWEKLRKGNFDAAFHRLEYFVIPNLDQHFFKRGSENYSGFYDAEVERLYTDSLRNAPITDMKRLWHKIQRRIGDAVPCAFLWTPRSNAAYTAWLDVENYYCPNNFICEIEKWRGEF